MNIEIDLSERQARENPICLGCFADKGVGEIVCWNCFKRTTDRTPYKYFQGSFDEWLLSTQ